VDRHLDIGADGLPNYKVGLSAQRLHGELAVCCDLLVRTLALLSDVCKLELKQLLPIGLTPKDTARGRASDQEAWTPTP